MDEFNSIANKELLWNIMNETGIFSDIPNTNIESIKRLFETKITAIERTGGNLELTELNKMILSDMMSEMESMRRQRAPLTAKEISQDRQERFNNEFEKQQSDFSRQISAPRPKDIDFRDKQDEPIGDNIDRLMNETIAQREKELNFILDKETEKRNNTVISIGEEVSHDIKGIEIKDMERIKESGTNPKRVHFEDEKKPPSTKANMIDFLSKLKSSKQTSTSTPIPTSTPTPTSTSIPTSTSASSFTSELDFIKERLNEIERKQDLILELLDK